MRLNITVGTLTMEAELSDSPTALEIADVLPLTSSFSTWGDEIYFAVPVEAELDATAVETVEVGDLGYWPTGRAFCIFFGPTPVSSSGKIVPASAVNLVGKVIGDARKFKSVMGERKITLERA